MAQVGLLLGPLIEFLLLSVLVALLGRGARGYSLPERLATGEGEPSLAARAARSPAVWTLGFVAACVGFAGAALAFVGVLSLPSGTRAAAGAGLVGGTALALVFYLFYGTFASARGRGLANSYAAALGSWAVGLLFVVVIALKPLGVV
ncbi:MAG: hypothetical protein ABEJ34_04475 [Haloferacaceae archaeon]